MSDFYISPTGAGKKDGSSWGDAATIDKLGSLVSKAGAGGTISLKADAGAYNVSASLTLAAGGTADAPVTIKGVSSSGAAMEALFVSNRAEVYTPTAVGGAEVFRLIGGANHIDFQNLGFKNVLNAFHFGADVTDIAIEHVTATNVNRFIEDYVSGGATTATVSDLTVRDVQINGFAKGAIRLMYDSHDILIENVSGDGKNIDGSNFATGIAIDGTAHDIVIKDTKMGNITDTVNAYRNGDGFATELGNYNISFINTYAYNATDAGYDLKSSSTKLIGAVAEGNTRNFRIWGNATLENVTGIDPVHHGGTSSTANLWVWTGGTAIVTDSTFTNSNSNVPVLDVATKATLTLANVQTNVAGAAATKIATGGILGGALQLIKQAAAAVAPGEAAPAPAVAQPVIDIVTTSAEHVMDATARTLTFNGTGAFAGTGNALDNSLTGGSGNDVLKGLAGADLLTGNGGNDTLDGGLGADTLIGGTGDDLYVVDNAGDIVTELVGGGIDTVNTGLATYIIGSEIERVAFTGSGDFAGTGNDLVNVITGGAGNDVLDGGRGADTLVGGLGNDVYLVDDAGDIVTEAAAAGTDTVRTTLAGYTLAANVEALAFTGNGDFAGTGNDLANSLAGGAGDDVLKGLAGADLLTGNGGNDTLDGGLGADTLIGGAGDDLYIVDNAGDVVTELAGGGIDMVRTSLATLTLSANVETLAFTGTGGFAGTGNDLANTITGGAGNDTLDGGKGADILIGGLGNDIYVVDNAGDIVTEAAGAGTDTVRTTLASYTLGSNIETLINVGSGDFTGTGNALDNLINGGAGKDILSAGLGNDTLNGRAGNDALNGGWGMDILHGDEGNDMLTGEAHLDMLYGDAGNDTIVGDYAALTSAIAGANDQAWGGDGNDTLYGDGITMSGGVGGKDYLYGGNGGDLIFGDADVVTGGTMGNDSLNGDAGNDWLYGDGRSVSAGVTGGKDYLNGGTGNDHLFGGLGNDTFMFDAKGFGNDIIGDFGQVGGDRDVISFAGMKLKFADLHISYTGGNAVIETPAHDTITLLGVSSLTTADFAF